jgi:hypothetical protein
VDLLYSLTLSAEMLLVVLLMEEVGFSPRKTRELLRFNGTLRQAQAYASRFAVP